MTAPILPIAAVDVPLPVLEARIAGLREQAHQLDPADAAFAALACACPTACSCDADFPRGLPLSPPNPPTATRRRSDERVPEDRRAFRR